MKTGTMMLRFHTVGTTLHEKTRLKKARRASCHHGKLSLSREYGRPSSPTAESLQSVSA